MLGQQSRPRSSLVSFHWAVVVCCFFVAGHPISRFSPANQPQPWIRWGLETGVCRGLHLQQRSKSASTGLGHSLSPQELGLVWSLRSGVSLDEWKDGGGAEYSGTRSLQCTSAVAGQDRQQQQRKSHTSVTFDGAG